MEKKDIYRKLRVLGKPESKIEYLNYILEREKLLDPETRYRVYEILGEQYEVLGKKDIAELISAAEHFEKAGQRDRAVYNLKKVIDKYMHVDVLPNHNIILKVAEGLERSGLYEEARSLRENLGEKFEKVGLSEDSSYLLELAIDIFEKAGLAYRAEIVKEKLGRAKKSE